MFNSYVVLGNKLLLVCVKGVTDTVSYSRVITSTHSQRAVSMRSTCWIGIHVLDTFGVGRADKQMLQLSSNELYFKYPPCGVVMY